MWDDWCVDAWDPHSHATWRDGVAGSSPVAEDDGWLPDGWSLVGAALAGIAAYEGVRRLVARGQDLGRATLHDSPPAPPPPVAAAEPSTSHDTPPPVDDDAPPAADLVAELISLHDLAPTDALKRRVVRSLGKAGVSLVDPAGGRFDEERHDVVGTVRAEGEVSPGTVVEVLRPGFVDSEGRVLRAAEVVVATDEAGVW